MSQRKARNGTSRKKAATGTKQVLVMPNDSTATVLIPKQIEIKKEENPAIKAEIEELRANNDKLIKDLQKIEANEVVVYKTKTAIIKEIAANTMRLIELGDIKEPQADVCKIVCNKLEGFGLQRSKSLAHKVLSESYKHMEFNPHKYDHLKQPQQRQQQPDIRKMPPTVNNNEDNETTIPLDDEEDFIIPAEQYEEKRKLFSPITNTHENYQYPLLQSDTILSALPKLSLPYEKLDRNKKREITEETLRLEDQVRKAQKEIRRRRREYLKICQKEQIALSPELDKNRQTHITAISRQSGISEASDAIDEHIEMWEKVKEALIKFKPPAHIAEKLAYYLRAENEFLKPWADQKFRKDTIGWHIAELENAWQGKHASAKKMKTIIETEKKSKDYDPFLEDQQLIAYLTREQVGDNEEKMQRMALILARAFRYKIALHKWYMMYPEKAIAKRKIELSPILSEKAFSGT